MSKRPSVETDGDEAVPLAYRPPRARKRHRVSPSPPTVVSRLNALPRDLALHLTSWLQLRDLLALRRTGRRWRRWAVHHPVWATVHDYARRSRQPQRSLGSSPYRWGGMALPLRSRCPRLYLSLRHLDLCFTGVTDVSPLAACTALTLLDLGNTGVADVSALAACTALTLLDLGNTGVADVSALAACTALTFLDLGETRVADVSALAACTALTHLDLRRIRVADVSALAACTALTHLDLYSTRVADVSALAACTALTYLDLEHTGVVDVSALAACTALTYLDLRSIGVDGVGTLRRACPRLSILLRPT